VLGVKDGVVVLVVATQHDKAQLSSTLGESH